MEKKSAFTLIELLFVLTIYGIIFGIIMITNKPKVNIMNNRKLALSAYNYLRTGVGDYIAKEGQINNPKTLCEYLARNSNIAFSNNSDIINNCKEVVLSDDFNAATPNFILNNGMAFFNFGDTIHDTDNALNPTRGYYVVYVDLDGERGNRLRDENKNKDVIGFIINIHGEILPYGDAATNKNYFLAGYQFLRTIPDSPSEWIWLDRNTTFKDAVCKTGTPLQTTNYCNSIDSVCESRICRYQIIK